MIVAATRDAARLFLELGTVTIVLAVVACAAALAPAVRASRMDPLAALRTL